MAELRIPLSYRPLPQQRAFHACQARIRAFGGAMAGGKTRAVCEDAFDHLLENPGILIPIIRQKHTAIVDTTRRTFYEQVLPSELRGRKDLVRIKQSQGEDWCQLWNGSKVSFVGLDDPGKFFSAEYGMAYFDEAHEIAMKDVLTVNTRLRQSCPSCAKEAAKYLDPENAPECNHYPHSMTFAFNPSFPGHWLQQFFVLGASRTEWGFKRDELVPPGSDFSIGDAEFFISRATDNKYLPKGYIDKNLAGLTTMQRRRYLEGMWEHVDGSGFFDADALAALTQAALERSPVLIGEPDGDPAGTVDDKKPQLTARSNGRLEVWAPPVRWHTDKNGDEVKPHRYVVSVDASSGASADYSAVQVIDVEEFAQVAEWQGKVDPDKLALAAFLIACVYNGALVVPEITGGWGFAVVKRVQEFCGKYKGPAASKPRLYTRPVVDRLSNRFTDLLGWDTNVKSRAQMLDVLEQSLRDGSLEVNGQRTLAELAAFAFPENLTGGDYRAPRARQGAHDDLVIALAIGCAVASRLPKQLRSPPVRNYEPQFGATGY